MISRMAAAALQVVGIGLALACGAVAPAFAADTFWYGVRSSNWGHGIDPNSQTRNWYSAAPPNGDPRDPPVLNNAVFAPGAVRFVANITTDHEDG